MAVYIPRDTWYIGARPSFRSMQGPSVNQHEFKRLKVGSRGIALKDVHLFFQLPKSVAGRQVRSSDRCSFLHCSCFRLRFSLWLLAMLTDICSQLQFKVVPSVEREKNVGPACLSLFRDTSCF